MKCCMYITYILFHFSEFISPITFSRYNHHHEFCVWLHYIRHLLWTSLVPLGLTCLLFLPLLWIPLSCQIWPVLCKYNLTAFYLTSKLCTSCSYPLFNMGSFIAAVDMRQCKNPIRFHAGTTWKYKRVNFPWGKTLTINMKVGGQFHLLTPSKQSF